MSVRAAPAPPPGRAAGEVSGAPARRPRGRPAACQHRAVTASPSSRPVRAAGVVVAVALLAACGGATGTVDAASTAGAPSTVTGAPTTTSSTTRGSAPAPSSAVPADAVTTEVAPTDAATTEVGAADTAPDVAEAVDPGGLTVTAVRAARQEGYDRVVFELAGSGTPGWRVEYVDSPTAPGSGDAVDVPGAATLQVTLRGVGQPYETGAEEVPLGAVPVSGTEHVAGVVYGATYEGTAVAWIGTDGPAPFRVYSLTGPSRVVVEVVDAG